MGHAKGASNKDISETNHEWNILRFNKVYYQMDSTWGAGFLNGDKFEKQLLFAEIRSIEISNSIIIDRK